MNVKAVGKPSAGSLTVDAHPSLLCLLESSCLNILASVPLNFVICYVRSFVLCTWLLDNVQVASQIAEMFRLCKEQRKLRITIVLFEN